MQKRSLFFWDTTLDPIDYPYLVKKKFFNESIKHRKNFVVWLGKISKSYNKEIDWWLKLPTSRDPYKSKLFKNLIILKILKDKKIKLKIYGIKVDSKELKSSIIKNTSFNSKLIKICDKKQKIYKNFFLILKSVSYILITFFLVNLFAKKKIIKNYKITLIDTFVDHRTGKNDTIYPNLQKILNKINFKHVFFVPTFIINRNLLNTLNKIKFYSKRNYIFKEHFISLNDLLRSLVSCFNQKKFYKNYKNFQGLDCSMILINEIKSKKDLFNEIVARLNFVFVKKLKEAGINVKKSINRFENQSVDRGWNLGFRTFFPDAKVLGYQGYLYYPQLTNQTPVFYEEKAKIIPDSLIITSKFFKKPRREFYKKLKIIIGPSIEKQSIFKNIKHKYNYKFVLALSGIKLVDKKLLEWTIYALEKNRKLKIIIKPHPILPIHKIINTKDKIFNRQVRVSNENINEILEKTQILISSGPTGIILESLAYSCKLFYLYIHPNDVLLTKNLPLSRSTFKFIENKDSLSRYMNISNLKKLKKKPSKLKNYFFTKIDSKNINIFI